MQFYEIPNFSSEKEFLHFAREKYRENKDSGFLMIDLSSLERQYHRFISFLPRVTPHYAIKCNPDYMVSKTLYSLGCGFDCASRGELEEAINEIHADPSRIIFANPCKIPEHIAYMKEVGVKRTTFDCVGELEKIKKIYPECEVVLRIETNDSKSRSPLSVVFGAKRDEWEFLIQECKRLNLNLVGVSFHIGSGSSDPYNFYDAIKNAAHVFSLAEQCGFKLTLLDIGGGFPGISEDPQILGFEEFAGEVNIALDEFFGNKKDLKIIAEPGRYFANGMMYAFLKVISRKVFEPKNYCHSMENSSELDRIAQKIGINPDTFEKKEVHDYYINESVNILFSLLFLESSTLEFVHLVNDHKNEERFPSNIYGFSSVKKELLESNVMLPKLEIGEEVYFKNLGSYSTSVAKGISFNGYTWRGNTYYFKINYALNLQKIETSSNFSPSV